MKNFNLSLQAQEKAKERIPGMTQLLSKRPDMFSQGVWPAYYSKASGSQVWDLDGNQYTDMSISAIGACVLGYNDPDVDGAVIKAIQNGVASSLNCYEEIQLAELLCEIHPWADMVRYARTGGEAMAVAVRIARASTGRDKIAFCGYHGWHDWYLAANLKTDNALEGHLIPGLEPAGVPSQLSGTALPFGYNKPEELEKILAQNKGEIAAVVMEPIRNIHPEDGFLNKVKELAKEAGAVFVFDEISAGFRICPGGSHLILGCEPDMAVFSKAIGNGYPMSAIIGKKSVMEAAQKTFISSTNWTERVGPAAALATIQKFIKNNVHEHLVDLGTRIQTGWQNAAEKTGLKVHCGGIPPLSHFNFEEEDPLSLKALHIQQMRDEGFLASNIYYSMFAHTFEEVDKYLEATTRSFETIAEAMEKGDVHERMEGRKSGTGFKRIT
ncbi:aminotransferase class III-fold pyridoxal phosphate-dependent enzyme [Desulfovibrio sp. JC022]|uniref:aminotransferase class III-fold pyridoxal phosphate-dependent enzyme n=1 Tax=Desulfovibrio sp. JC022 TaxID=2593642 RepID=UPI0013CF4B33|nr:aminotransferase class III-fold pyridoxal phosphate-dependent enzyme [Desulfovibrio sp. JC022]NDV22164.1 aminotransferase class III-fold pyridoxal phosphate-dependent enzyme [Desulfovibrio sp. JC022]